MAADLAAARQAALSPPYRTALKPYGRALAELARVRPEVVCLSGDLTRQCEVDLFAEQFPERFIHAGMAEANMIGVAGALARQGLMPFVHSFGVFVTRRPFESQRIVPVGNVPYWSQSSEDVQFAYKLAESTKGRVFFTAGRDLDRYVVWDYLNRRREIIA